MFFAFSLYFLTLQLHQFKVFSLYSIHYSDVLDIVRHFLLQMRISMNFDEEVIFEEGPSFFISFFLSLKRLVRQFPSAIFDFDIYKYLYMNLYFSNVLFLLEMKSKIQRRNTFLSQQLYMNSKKFLYWTSFRRHLQHD